MNENFFAYISRMRYITRWSLMRNSYSENIQEHSHMVAVLAHALAVIRNRCFGGTVDAGAVAVAALYHDASEILTGDLPTPIKYHNPADPGIRTKQWNPWPRTGCFPCWEKSWRRSMSQSSRKATWM